MLPLPLPLLAFGFGHLAMLGWLVAAAAPLIIHLWSRRHHLEIPWAAVEFLVAALEKNARRVQLLQWLLLAARTLVIILVVLAVAEPYAERLGLSYAPSVRTHRMFVLDGSYSMGYRPADMSLFSRAKHLIREIIDGSRQGDAFTLVLLGDPPRAIVGHPTFSKNDFLAELDGITLPDAGGDLAATLRIVLDVLKQVRSEQPALDRHEIYFVTDLGRTTWQPNAGSFSNTLDSPTSLSTGMNQSTWEQLAKLAELIVFDVGLDDAQNTAVTSMTTSESFSVVGRDGVYEAAVRNFGSQPKTKCLVQFLVDNMPIEDRRIDIPAGSEATVRFVHRFNEPGSHVIAARLGNDLLDADDTRWLAISVQQQLRVLCVEGKHNAARYIANALAPDPSSLSMIRVETIHESEFVEFEIKNFDCVFLCNIEQLTPGEIEEIGQYLQQGGGIIMFLGDLVIPERINRAMGSDPNTHASSPSARNDSDRIPLLPVSIGELAPESQYHFDPLEYRHPIIQPFRGHEAAGLLSTPVYRYFRLEIQPNMPQVEVALALDSGDPAIVIAPVHQGHVAVIATAGSLASVDSQTKNPWTVWPVWPSFLPIVRGLLDHTIGGRRDLHNVRVGQPFGEVLSGSNVVQGDKVEVTRPDGTTHVVRLRNGAGQMRWIFEETDRAGVYQAIGGASPDARTQFAVNLDTSESDLAKVMGSDLPSQLTVHKTWMGFDEPIPISVMRPYHIHRRLIYLAILLLFLESYLGWKFGKVVA
ncbi:MAG: VWA domain-containing protein [Pirellulales bacterium]|nr:VWA domain-containing protein [Pirellulales bacterium]